MTTIMVEVGAINDGGAQMRVEMRPEIVAEYAEEMAGGATFPPVIVFRDEAGDHWLADGFHRVEAAKKIGREEIEAEVREGSQREAVLHGIGSNATHGLRRTQADKRRAVERLLCDPEWAKWSDRQVARVAKVDHKTIAAVRRDLTGGEIPKAKKANGMPNGEIPKPKAPDSLIETFFATVSDEELIAECRRRGLTVASDA